MPLPVLIAKMHSTGKRSNQRGAGTRTVLRRPYYIVHKDDQRPFRPRALGDVKSHHVTTTPSCAAGTCTARRRCDNIFGTPDCSCSNSDRPAVMSAYVFNPRRQTIDRNQEAADQKHVTAHLPAMKGRQIGRLMKSSSAIE